MREVLTFFVVTLPRWIREFRFHARQDYVSPDWTRAHRKVKPEDAR